MKLLLTLGFAVFMLFSFEISNAQIIKCSQCLSGYSMYEDRLVPSNCSGHVTSCPGMGKNPTNCVQVCGCDYNTTCQP